MKIEVKVAKAAFAPDDLTRACVGLPLDQLVQAIIDNRGGRFDALYRKEAAECPSAITASTS